MVEQPGTISAKSHVGTPGPAVERKAPMFAKFVTFRPVIFPSRVAPVDRRDEVFAPVLRPADGMLEHARGEDRQRIARVVGDLAAKAAADIARDDANLVLWDVLGDGDEEPHDMRVLRGVVEGQLIGAFTPVGDGRAWLHRVWHEPLLNEALLDANLGSGQRTIGVAIAELPVERLIARRTVIELRRARLERFFLVDDSGQLFV